MAQIDPDLRDRVVPAAVAIAVNVRWQEHGLEWVVPFPVGSGTFVSPDGKTLTNRHVVDPVELRTQLVEWNDQLRTDNPDVELELIEGDFLILTSDGLQPPEPAYTARVVRNDRRLDLAILQVVGDEEGFAGAIEDVVFSFVPMGDSDSLRLGDRVHVFAYSGIGGIHSRTRMVSSADSSANGASPASPGSPPMR